MNFSDHSKQGHRKTIQSSAAEEMSAFLDEVEDSIGVNARKADRDAEAASEAAFDALEAKWSGIVGGSVVVLSGAVQPIQDNEVMVIDLCDLTPEPVLVETIQKVVQEPATRVYA